MILFRRETPMRERKIKGKIKDPFSNPANNLIQEMILIFIQILMVDCIYPHPLIMYSSCCPYLRKLG